MNSGLPEFARSDLTPRRFGILEDSDGKWYRPHHGATDDPAHNPALVGFFIDRNGWPIYVERPNGPASAAEFAARRAEREQRKASPKPKPRRKQ
jgi:hypothetical protein